MYGYIYIFKVADTYLQQYLQPDLQHPQSTGSLIIKQARLQCCR